MSKFSIIVQIILLFTLNSCEGYRMKKYTPNEYLNHTVAKREDYSRDSIEILKQLKSLLLNHKGFFGNTSYDHSTQLIIDSIIYSPDLNRLAVFIITKNPTSRQSIPDKKNYWYYDATCYLGVKENDTISLSWEGPNFSNSTNQQKLSGIIRKSYFTEFADNDTSQTSTSKYNLNDTRFWNSFIWKKTEGEKIKEREFEKGKKEHPKMFLNLLTEVTGKKY